MKPAEQIALWADKLRDVSAMGLMFAKSIHDETAYRAVQTIALEMLALATGESWEQIEPSPGNDLLEANTGICRRRRHHRRQGTHPLDPARRQRPMGDARRRARSG